MKFYWINLSKGQFVTLLLFIALVSWTIWHWNTYGVPFGKEDSVGVVCSILGFSISIIAVVCFLIWYITENWYTYPGEKSRREGYNE